MHLHARSVSGLARRCQPIFSCKNIGLDLRQPEVANSDLHAARISFSLDREPSDFLLIEGPGDAALDTFVTKYLAHDHDRNE